MPETVSSPQPLTNHELQRYVQTRADQHTNPTSSDFVGNANVGLHNASYEYLDARLGLAERPLVSDKHELATGQLEEDFAEVSAWLDSDIRNLRSVLRNPTRARDTIKQAYGEDWVASPDPDTLSLEEVHEYLGAVELANRSPDEHDHEMHSMSLGVLSNLVDDWRRNQLAKDGENPDNADVLAYPGGTKSYGPGVSTLETHVSQRRHRFETVTTDLIHELGETALDASATRAHIATSEPQTRPSTPDTTIEDPEMQRLKEQHAKLRVSSGTTTNTRSRQPHSAETADKDIGEQAAEAAKTMFDEPSPERHDYDKLFNTIVESTKGRTHLDADGVNGFGSLGDGEKGDSAHTYIGSGMPISKEVELSTNNVNEHLNEAVSFTEVVEPDTIIVDKPAAESAPPPKKDVWSRKAQPATSTRRIEKNPNAGKAITMDHEGKEEPIVRFRYQFQYSAQAIVQRAFPEYREFRGSRQGQHILLGVDLPKSVAAELQQQIQNDPKSARVLAERLFLENNDGTLTKKLWERGGDSGKPIRPPYPELPQNWQIAIVTGTEVDGSNGSIKPGYEVNRTTIS